MKPIITIALLLSLVHLSACTTTSYGGSQDFIQRQPEYMAAVGGNPAAQYRVAVYFLRFRDLVGFCSQKKGLKWLELSAAQNYAPAIQLMNQPTFSAPSIERAYCGENTDIPVAASTPAYTVTRTMTSSGTINTDVKTRGSLQSNYTLGCIDITSVSNQYTPADLYKAAAQCIREDRYKQSAELFTLASVYGYFDAMRVSDITARQAPQMLIIQDIRPVMSTLPIEKQQQWQAIIKSSQAPNSPEIAVLCSKMRQIGAPAYYSSYMIQHGLNAATDALENKVSKNGLTPNFNAAETWNKTLSMHCPNV